MDTKYFEKNLSIIEKQRNLFLLLTFLTIAGNLLLSLKSLASNEKIIMVPALKKDIWVSTNSVSATYMEEMSNLLFSHLLDINPNNILYKKSLIMQHIDQDDPKAVSTINRYFTVLEEKYRKFGLSTYFTAKDILIDTESLTAKVSGILTSHYGKRGADFSEELYLLSFKYKFGRLILKHFEKLTKDEK